MTVAEATIDKIDQAVQSADAAFASYRELANTQRAKFLDAIAAEIENLGEALIQTANRETALPAGRKIVYKTATENAATNGTKAFTLTTKVGSTANAESTAVQAHKMSTERR